MVVACIKHLRAHPGAFVDIGANIGSFTVPVATAPSVPPFPIHAFEGHPKNVAVLRRSIARNGLESRVRLHACLVTTENATDENGTSTIGDCKGNWGGCQSAFRGRQYKRKRLGKNTVPACTVDGANLQNISLVKIDCEGCEGHALYSANHTLTRHPPLAIVMELTEQYLLQADTPWREVLEYMASKGYVAYDHYRGLRQNIAYLPAN